MIRKKFEEYKAKVVSGRGFWLGNKLFEPTKDNPLYGKVINEKMQKIGNNYVRMLAFCPDGEAEGFYWVSGRHIRRIKEEENAN